MDVIPLASEYREDKLTLHFIIYRHESAQVHIQTYKCVCITLNSQDLFVSFLIMSFPFHKEVVAYPNPFLEKLTHSGYFQERQFYYFLASLRKSFDSLILIFEVG